MIVKVYQGATRPERLLEDLRSVPRTPTDRIRKALPFAGALYQGSFQRNHITYGVALFQFGYLEQAAASFQHAIAAKPQDPEAHYNLGTLYLRRNALSDARRSLERAVQLRPNYPEAWNNLGMLAAQEGQAEEAIRNFQQSLLLRPDYAIALVNLGNFYRRQGTLDQAEKMLMHALAIEPEERSQLWHGYALRPAGPTASGCGVFGACGEIAARLSRSPQQSRDSMSENSAIRMPSKNSRLAFELRRALTRPI